MKTYQTVLAIFSLLALTESVRGQVSYACFQPMPYQCEKWYPEGEGDGIPEALDFENTVSYSLPDPLVNTTLTSFGQNPFFASQVSSVSSQIAQNIASAITQAAEAVAAYDSLSSIPLFGPIIQSFQGLSINITAQTNAIQNLLSNFNSIIGNEVDAAIVQNAINDYNSNVQAWQAQINSIQNLTNMDVILPTLISVETLIEQAYEDFDSGSTFNLYPYYTTQLLYINAIMHINVLNLLGLSCQIASEIGNGDNENQDSSYYFGTAEAMTTNYLNLLQQYANDAVSYRMGFITAVTCATNEEEEDSIWGNVLPTQNNVYSFSDNFIGQIVATVHEKWYSTEEENDYVCFGSGVQMQDAQVAYTQAIQSGTTAVFDEFVSNFTSIASASTDSQ